MQPLRGSYLGRRYALTLQLRLRQCSGMSPTSHRTSGPGYAFMSARSMVKLDTNAGKPSLTPLP